MASYKKITKPEEINKLLNLAHNNVLFLRVVRRQNDNDLDFYVLIRSLQLKDSLQRTVSIDVNDDEWKQYLSEKKTFLCFFLDAGASYYFKFEIIDSHKTGFVCKVPDLVYRVQRRKYYRVDVMGQGMKAGFTDPEKGKGLIVRSLIDIGVGGCAIQISKEDTKYIKLSNILYGFRLKLGPNHYISPIPIIRFVGMITTSDGSRVFKCGLEFIKIDPQDEKDLSYHVYALQRKEVLKLHR